MAVGLSDSESGAGSVWAPRLVALAFLSLATAFLYIVGRPLFTDDAWWHLALGKAFAAAGPWLEADPILHTSNMPPVPAAWLSDIFLYATSLGLGLVGLRMLHVVVVAAILGGVWLALRRASGSRAVASFATALFLVFSAYRLSQLRPELATLAASIALYVLLLQGREMPSWKRVGGGAVLCGLWANLHPAFPLGPVLIAAACAGTWAELWLRKQAPPAELRGRAGRLGWATLLGIGASFMNPMAGAAYLLYFGAGQQAPAMTLVVDEWTPLDPFRLPAINLPPSPLAWIAYWALGIASLAVIALVLRRWREQADSSRAALDLDGALLPLALLGILAPLFAVRFLWLSVFPLLLLASAARDAFRQRRARQWALAGVALLLVSSFLRIGDWPLLSSGVSRATYLDPYDRWKYHGHAVGFLRESGIEGNLYNSYYMGGFLGYWLAPCLRVFIDGSLHIPPQVMEDYLALQSKGGGALDFDATALLDRYGVDVYLGIGFPTPPLPNRPWRYTSRHLEGDPEWILVFRSMQSAVYLRRNERNRENIRRIQAYYASLGVPFDPNTGIDVARVVDQSLDWALSNGLLPRNFERLVDASQRRRAPASALDRLASAYLALGLDGRALDADALSMSSQPTVSAPRRRRIGALLRLDRTEEALAEAEQLALLRPGDSLSRRLIDVARRYVELDDSERQARLALLPVLSRSEANRLRVSRVPATPLALQCPE